MSFRGIIYLVINNVNNKMYVGQTTRLLKMRISAHLSASKHHNHKDYNCIFYKAIRKYNENNFSWYIIDICNTNKEHLNQLEKHYIEYFNSYFKYNCGYNMTYGGDGTTGYRHTEAAKNIMRNKRLGKSTMSEEAKNKMSDRLKGNRNHRFGIKPHKNSQKAIDELNDKTKISIKCNETGEIFESIRLTAKVKNIPRTSLKRALYNKKSINGLTYSFC